MKPYLISEYIDQHLTPILYVLNRVGRPVNRYNLLKILYFADKLCLSKYNRKVTNDWYEKKEYGPVAFHSYAILKAIEGRNSFLPSKKLKEFIRWDGLHCFEAINKVDLERFSSIEMECLDEAILENINLTFDELLDKSHDEAYKNTDSLNTEIDKYDIAKAGGANEEQIEYMREIEYFERLEWR
ncbi:Panacea domain-containing protein [Ornithobacterium rhinotracheale]|uniref:Panacea domain-containing protein n=1 Tax=Ornithobacterium rhinotracheale TaxID=28251 RepID=UPI0040351482